MIRYGSVTAVLLVFLLILMGCTGGKTMASPFLVKNKAVVGNDIVAEDITEFYYTYATSTNPPRYQRYRFYVKESSYLFYHEKREGNHWPLTEKDITVSGTKELSKDQWTAFFNCVKGGNVKKREESTEDGGHGPWLFLYWKGDRSEYQQFSFASVEKKKSFEELCSMLKNENKQ